MSSFIETDFFKRVKNFILGAGAAVVLLGALFKILHWQGATEMLMIGMFTEAFIFLFLGVLPPHKDYYWEKIYPGLDIAPDVQYMKKSGLAKPEAKGTVTQQLDKMLEEAHVEKDLIQRLGTNLQKFGENLEKLNEVTDAGAATNEYTKEARGAATALSAMRTAYNDASAAVGELAKVSSDTKEYHEQVTKVSQNLASLNAIYEVELKDTTSHLKSLNQFYSSLNAAVGNLNESVEDTKRYKEQMNQLSGNLTKLNSIYGNMLAAMSMNQPR